MEPIESFQGTSRVSHTAGSLQLAGEPIAKLQNVSPYPSMSELNLATVSSMHCHDSAKRIYTVYLSSMGHEFAYNGYTQLSQIGQYYAVTINDKKTRLYTMVNFLTSRNVKLM